MSTPPTSPPHVPARVPSANSVLGDHADDLRRLAADASPTVAALLQDQADATRRLADLLLCLAA